jgi:hypothetical protein
MNLLTKPPGRPEQSKRLTQPLFPFFTMKKTLRLFSLLCCLLAGAAALGQTAQKGATPSFPAGNAYAKANITTKIIPAEGNTWGYDILIEGERFVHQSSKPGLPGNRGFATKAKAQKVADLVVAKIKKGQMPPSVSIEEMKQLKSI